jgi:hypothetical protein
MIDSLNNFHYFSTEVEVVTAAATEVAAAEVGTTTEAKTERPETGGRARPQPRVVETTGRTDTNRLETEVSFCYFYSLARCRVLPKSMVTVKVN